MSIRHQRPWPAPLRCPLPSASLGMEPAPAPMPPAERRLTARHFTARSVAAGLGVGFVICAANVYFGLQTGWVSIMSMPASLMGFGVFRLLRHHLQLPFIPVENVLLQSVACGMAIMPLGCGLVGVIPAMNYLTPDEQGPLSLTVAQLVVWSLGLFYFSVVFAVPLRRQVIREWLRFPSGFSTAVLISVFHGQDRPSPDKQVLDAAASGAFPSLVEDPRDPRGPSSPPPEADGPTQHEPDAQQPSSDWASNMRLLVLCFCVSGLFTICTYFLPVLRSIPVFGTVAAETWLWTLNPSLDYVGQCIIMGAETTLHMTLGAVIGWGLLSPLAKSKGWTPGPVDDWEHGSKGWIVWVSLAVMLVDAVVSLGYVALRAVLATRLVGWLEALRQRLGLAAATASSWPRAHRYAPLPSQEQDEDPTSPLRGRADESLDQPDLVPLYATVVAVLMALLSIMGVRALGETDLNPVSGISKLAQLFFAFIIPQSNKSSVLINLTGAVVSPRLVLFFASPPLLELALANRALHDTPVGSCESTVSQGV